MLSKLVTQGKERPKNPIILIIVLHYTPTKMGICTSCKIGPTNIVAMDHNDD